MPKGSDLVTALQKVEFVIITLLAVIFCFFTFYILIRSRKEKKQLVRKINLLEKELRYDYLTGTLSRKAFIDEVESELANNFCGTLLIFDVNGFKTINDTYGHIEGDKFIKRFSHKLLKAFPNDFVGRLGGDEFLVFVKGECDKKEINQKIKRAGITEFSDKPTKLTLTSSCGAAVAPNNGTTFDDLYLMADKALYRSKKGSHSITYCK